MNLRHDCDSVILRRPGVLFGISNFAVSPDGSKVVFKSIQNGNSHTLDLELLDLNTEVYRRIISVPDTAVITYEWSRDGRSVGIGYYFSDFWSGSGRPSGDVLIYDTELSSLRSLDCSRGRKFLSWYTPSIVEVRGRTAKYLVDTTNCKTVRTLVCGDEREEFALSYQTRKKLISRRVPDRSQDVCQGASHLELAIATFDGSWSKTICDESFSPSKLSLSPDGSLIAFEIVASDQLASNQIIVYDVVADSEISVTGRDVVQEDPIGEKPVYNPTWSASGARLAFSITIRHRDVEAVLPSYGATSIGILDLHSYETRSWGKRISYRNGKGDWMGETSGWLIGWLGDDYIVAGCEDWTRVYGVNGEIMATLSSGETPFAVTVGMSACPSPKSTEAHSTGRWR
jgi:hypothetical protein